MKFEFGDAVNLEYGTDVKIKINGNYVWGKVVGLAARDLTNSHIIKCTDDTFPNSVYDYDCFAIPKALLETIDK
jgi:hypothetical protein